MRTKQAVIVGVLLTAAALLYAAYLYPALPERVPTHWNWRGDVDGWMPKTWGAFYPAGFMALFALMIVLLPWLSPRNFRVDTFRETFNYCMVVTVVLMGYLQVITVQAGLHPDTDIRKGLFAGLFLFFALLGNVLGKVRRNFWIGVRTPWTLSSDTVWNATHRLAARLYVAAGLAGALAVWLGVPIALCATLFVVVLFVPVVHSLILYKRMEADGRA